MATPIEEKKTPVFDWANGDFKVDMQGHVETATEGPGAEQIAIKALETARSMYTIYLDADPDLNDKYGSEVHDISVRRDMTEPVRIEEIKRAVYEALIYDPWVTDVTDIVVTRRGTDEVLVDMTLHTIFDIEIPMIGVTIFNG